MRIGVVVSGWEQSCCGNSFRVGDDVVWDLVWAREGIAASFGPDEAAGVDFAETHHGGGDKRRTARVAGSVASIRAMSQRIHRPDPAGPWTNVDGESTGSPVEQVPGRMRIEPEEPQATPVKAPDPPAAPDSPPSEAAERRVFLAAAGGWYARRGPRDPLQNELAERRTDAGWIVQLDVANDATLPEAPSHAS
jgi:hypothetical protein